MVYQLLMMIFYCVAGITFAPALRRVKIVGTHSRCDAGHMFGDGPCEGISSSKAR